MDCHSRKPLSPLVLVVDDHLRFRQRLRQWLEAACPHVLVVEADCGEQAVEEAVRRRPALVLMDLGLPGVDGFEATRRITAAAPAVAVVAMSVADTVRHRSEAAAAGAVGFLAKRTIAHDLEAVVQRYCPGGPPAGAQAVAGAGGGRR